MELGFPDCNESAFLNIHSYLCQRRRIGCILFDRFLAPWVIHIFRPAACGVPHVPMASGPARVRGGVLRRPWPLQKPYPTPGIKISRFKFRFLQTNQPHSVTFVRHFLLQRTNSHRLASPGSPSTPTWIPHTWIFSLPYGLFSFVNLFSSLLLCAPPTWYLLSILPDCHLADWLRISQFTTSGTKF